MAVTATSLLILLNIFSFRFWYDCAMNTDREEDCDSDRDKGYCEGSNLICSLREIASWSEHLI